MAKLPKIDLGGETAQKVTNIYMIPVEELEVNDEYNSRRYHANNIEGMMEQLLRDGRQINPVQVRRRPAELSKLTTLSGFRRAKAMKALKENGMLEPDSPLNYIMVEDYGEVDDTTAYDLNVSENIREDPSVIDIAHALDLAVNFHGRKAKDAVKPYGKSAAWASQTMSLLKLPVDIQKRIHEGKLAVSAGLELVGLIDNPEEFEAALQRIKSGGTVTRSDIRDMARDASLARQESGGGSGSGESTSTAPAGGNGGGGNGDPAPLSGGSTAAPVPQTLPQDVKTPLTLKQAMSVLRDRLAFLEDNAPDDHKYMGDQHTLISTLVRVFEGRTSSAAAWRKINDILPNQSRPSK